jgi:type II secretory pathway pseudopilin PulG
MLALTVVGVLLAMCVPTFQRGLEQARADTAGANLRALWSAQRLYWLENRTFTVNFSDLGDLFDPAVGGSTYSYVYTVTWADASTFTATATRVGSSTWSGQLTIDQTGTVTGSVTAAGQAGIAPGFQ